MHTTPLPGMPVPSELRRDKLMQSLGPAGQGVLKLFSSSKPAGQVQVTLTRGSRIVIDDPDGVRVFGHEVKHLSNYNLVLNRADALEPGMYVAHFLTQYGSGEVPFIVPDTPFNPLSMTWNGGQDGAGVELVYRGLAVMLAGQQDVTVSVPAALSPPRGRLAWNSTLSLTAHDLVNGWRLSCISAVAQDTEIRWIAY